MECQFCCAWPLPTGIREKTLRLRRQQGSALFKARGAGVCGRYRPRAGRTRIFPRPPGQGRLRLPNARPSCQFPICPIQSAGLGHVKRRHIGRSSRKYYFILSLKWGRGRRRARPLAGPAAGKLCLPAAILAPIRAPKFCAAPAPILGLI